MLWLGISYYQFDTTKLPKSLILILNYIMSINKNNLFLPGETVRINQEAVDYQKLDKLHKQDENYNFKEAIYVTQKEYLIVEYVGAGLGGAVWKAIDKVGGQPVAIKIYNPPGLSGILKKLLINALHLFCFQSKFPYRYIKESLLSNMVASNILSDILAKNLGYSCLAKTKAVFFNYQYSSWAEIIEWVEGRHYQANKRKEFIQALKQFNQIAKESGFRAHSYQVEHRLGACAHTVKNILQDSSGKFWWVDKMPAVPICLIGYPYHFKIVFENIKVGNFYPSFDQVNLDKLKTYLADNFNPANQEKNLILLNLYKKLRKDYLESRIDFLARFKNPGLNWKVKEKLIKYWDDCGQLSKRSVKFLAKNPVAFSLFACLDLIPFFGKLLRKAFLNPIFFKELSKLISPLFHNSYRRNKWEVFKYRYTKKMSRWILNDLIQLYDQDIISKQQLDKFEAETKTLEWRSYLKIIFFYAVGKIPGDFVAAGLGGYALFDLFKLISQDNFYFSVPIMFGILGIFIPGIYRAIVALIVKKRNPQLIFRWYWILFAIIPSFGYLSVILQVLSKTLSLTASWYLLKYKVVSGIKGILDIIPGYREFDFYILNRFTSF